MKTATVNGQVISAEAVAFELERLVKFYASHGWSAEDVKAALPKLQAQALEQAIGAKLLLERASQVEIPVAAEDVDKKGALCARADALIAQVCAHVDDPTEQEITSFKAMHKNLSVEAIRDMLRHEARGRAIRDFMDELRAAATIEYTA